MLAAAPRAPKPPANPISDPPQVWRQTVESLGPFLAEVTRFVAEQVDLFDPALLKSAHHALTAAGKQLRPILLGLCAEATGRPTAGHVKAAAIIEMVHLATLVHDDVLDEAKLRRGRRTLASTQGNEHAVLFGDCLFAHALELATSYPTPEVCRCVAASTKAVCTGEILQNQQRLQFDLTQAEYFRVLEMKTAELFALSCELGAFLNDAPAAERSALRRYGLALGIAYQIYDDCLDLFGSELAAGKSLGTDLAHGKLTLPFLLFRETASNKEQAHLRKLLTAWEPAALAKVDGLLREHRALERAQTVIQEYVRRSSMAAAPLGERGVKLLGLADFLAVQTNSLGPASLP